MKNQKGTALKPLSNRRVYNFIYSADSVRQQFIIYWLANTKLNFSTLNKFKKKFYASKEWEDLKKPWCYFRFGVRVSFLSLITQFKNTFYVSFSWLSSIRISVSLENTYGGVLMIGIRGWVSRSWNVTWALLLVYSRIPHRSKLNGVRQLCDISPDESCLRIKNFHHQS